MTDQRIEQQLSHHAKKEHMAEATPHPAAANAKVIENIREERARQDAQWGGATHNDEHIPEDFFSFMRHQMTSAETEASTVSRDIYHMRLSIDQLGPKTRAAYRCRPVKIAALAVAAIESIERNHDNRVVRCHL